MITGVGVGKFYLFVFGILYILVFVFKCFWGIRLEIDVFIVGRV